MVMNRIDDRGGADNKAAENNEIERTSNTGPKRDALAEPEPEPGKQGPNTDPLRRYRGSLAFLSDGRTALSLAYVEGADLTGRERWEGIILEPEEAEEAHEGLSDAADGVAANIGGSIRWRKDKPENDEGADGHG